MSSWGPGGGGLLFRGFCITSVSAGKGEFYASFPGRNRCGVGGCMVDIPFFSKNRSLVLPGP